MLKKLDTLQSLNVLNLVVGAVSVAATITTMIIEPKIQTLEIKKAVAEAIAKQA
jgi:hypothetical protein